MGAAGGIIVTTLVCEVYKQNASRNDVALADTLKAHLARLKASVKVENPVQPGVYFTSSPPAPGGGPPARRARREASELGRALPGRLPPPTQAMGAWDAIFWRDYWTDAKKEAARSAVGATGLAGECWLAKKSEGPVYKQHRNDSAALPKGIHLRFTAVPNGVAPPYNVRWSVRNEGPEAKENGWLEQRHREGRRRGVPDFNRLQGASHDDLQAHQGRYDRAAAEHGVRIGPGRRVL